MNIREEQETKWETEKFKQVEKRQIKGSNKNKRGLEHNPHKCTNHWCYLNLLTTFIKFSLLLQGNPGLSGERGEAGPRVSKPFK
jgi:hypothetical protein